jgi:hypothetical protein
MVSDRLCVLLNDGCSESVTCRTSVLADTALVGTPLIAPVEALSDKPAGKVLFASDQLYGVTPPVAVSVAAYAVPTCPFGSALLVMASVGTACRVTELLLEPAVLRQVSV